MSTRGAVAWRKKNGEWEGIYNHFDSYPGGLGEEVLKAIKKYGVERLIKELKPFDDWRQLESGGVCQFCGKGVGQPHSYGGICLNEESVRLAKKAIEKGETSFEQYPTLKTGLSAEVIENIKRTGYSDPEAKDHGHNKPGKKVDPRESPLFLEYVYVLCPEKNAVEVWAHTNAATVPLKVEFTRPVPLGHGEKECYIHYKVGEFTPNFKSLDAINKADQRLNEQIEKLYVKVSKKSARR